jgi:hypothetical protein
MGKCPSLDLKKLPTHTRNSSMNTTEEYEGKTPIEYKVTVFKGDLSKMVPCFSIWTSK